MQTSPLPARGIGISITSSTDGEPGLVITNLRGMRPLAHTINQCLHTNFHLSLELPYPASDAILGEQESDLWPVQDGRLVYPRKPSRQFQ